MIERSIPQITLLRIIIGTAWIIAGYEKVRNPAWDATFRTMLQHWGAGSSSIANFINLFVLPNITALTFAVKAGEILIGVLLVIGLFVPLAALGGFLIIGAAWVFKQSYLTPAGYTDGNFIEMVAMLFLMLTPSVQHFGIDRIYWRRGNRVRSEKATQPLPGFEQPAA
jgi:uncharacterized membrane protein YphA (DoxX/SURF4 family)